MQIVSIYIIKQISQKTSLILDENSIAKRILFMKSAKYFKNILFRRIYFRSRLKIKMRIIHEFSVRVSVGFRLSNSCASSDYAITMTRLIIPPPSRNQRNSLLKSN